MPFSVATNYWNPSQTFQPDDGQLAKYIAWLERELMLAKQEHAGRHPPKPKEFSSAAQAMASKGGKARSAKLTPQQRKEIAQKAARTRWASDAHRHR